MEVILGEFKQAKSAEQKVLNLFFSVLLLSQLMGLVVVVVVGVMVDRLWSGSGRSVFIIET